MSVHGENTFPEIDSASLKCQRPFALFPFALESFQFLGRVGMSVWVGANAKSGGLFFLLFDLGGDLPVEMLQLSGHFRASATLGEQSGSERTAASDDILVLFLAATGRGFLPGL
jgi:hypothetical protein